MGKIRITFVASTLEVGGAERVMFDLVTRLPESRFDTRFYFLRAAGRRGRELLGRGVRGAERLERWRGDPWVAVRLARYFRRHETDIAFHLDHRNAMLWGRIGAILAGVERQVVASHSTGKYGGIRSFTLPDRWLMDFTDRVVALSESHAGYLAGVEAIDPGKIRIVPNGIDVEGYGRGDAADARALRRELGAADDDAVVIMLAALRPEKAHEALLEAASRMQQRGLRVRVWVAGDGPRRAFLEARARDLGVDGIVSFLGIRDDVARLLHAADMLALPSQPVVETLPLAVLEAMAAGLPVIASRVGTLPEVIETGVNGILIDPADGMALADAIAYVVGNPDATAEMAERARATVARRYSMKSMVDGYVALFEELVEAQ